MQTLPWSNSIPQATPQPRWRWKAAEGRYVYVAFLFWFSVLSTPRLLSSEEVPTLLSKLRLEDLLLPFFLAYLFERRNELAAVLGFQTLRSAKSWAWFVTVATAANCLARGFPLWQGMAFAGKELQYLVALCFFAVFARRHGAAALWGVLFAALPGIAYGLWQLATGEFAGYYGVKTIFEGSGAEGSPSESGGILALLFVCSFAVLLNRRAVFATENTRNKLFLYPLTGIFFLLLVVTISRSNIIGALVAVGLLALPRLWRGAGHALPLFLALLACGAGAWYLSSTPLYDAVATRFTALGDSALDIRMENWKVLVDYQFQHWAEDPLSIAFGFGLSSPSTLFPSTTSLVTLGVDNQYIRRVFEVGLIGTMIWFRFLASAARKILRNVRGTRFAALFRDAVLGIFAIALIASGGLEVLQVIRIASVFYALLGVLLGLSAACSDRLAPMPAATPLPARAAP